MKNSYIHDRYMHHIIYHVSLCIVCDVANTDKICKQTVNSLSKEFLAPNMDFSDRKPIIKGLRQNFLNKQCSVLISWFLKHCKYRLRCRVWLDQSIRLGWGILSPYFGFQTSYTFSSFISSLVCTYNNYTTHEDFSLRIVFSIRTWFAIISLN